MDFSTTAVSVGIAMVTMVVVTLAVSAVIRRSPSTATYRATKGDVLFVVSTRRWQRVLIRTVGIVVLMLDAVISAAQVFREVDDTEIAADFVPGTYDFAAGAPVTARTGSME